MSDISYAITICYPTPMPYLFGGISGYTRILTLKFIDSSGDIIVGGGTSDTSLGSSGPLPVPFVAHILSGGSSVIWANLYQTQSITGCNVAALAYKMS